MKISISYTVKTFDDIITVGALNVEYDSMDEAKQNAYYHVMQELEDCEDEETAWHCNIKSIDISVKPKS